MRATLSPTTLTAEPGREVVLTLTLTNTSTIIGAYDVRALGLDPAWVRIETPRLSLFPEQTGSTIIHVALPQDIPAGQRTVTITVSSDAPPEETVELSCELVVPTRTRMRISLDPPSQTAGASVRFGVLLENLGNTDVEGALSGFDEAHEIAFAFDPDRPTLHAGERLLGSVALTAKRPWFGAPQLRAFAVALTSDQLPPDGGEVRTQGSWVQSPRLSRGILALIGLVIAGTVFATVIAASLSQIVNQSNANSRLALQVAQAAQAKPASATASIAGEVRLQATGKPVAGVTVDLYQPSSTSPVASVATNTQGSYTLAGLAPGTYDLSFTGAGFTPLWYPGVTAQAQATSVTLSGGEHLHGIDIAIGAVPVTIAGSVTGSSPTGASVVLALPSATPLAEVSSNGIASVSASGVIVARTTVTQSGTFSFTNVPSPGTYQLVATKQGDAPVVQNVSVGSGQSQTGIQLVLTAGTGLVSGTVEGPNGPIGGATITATVGTTTETTVSLTSPGQVGSFTLADLPTPATLSVTVTAPRYAAQTLSVTLGLNQHLSGELVLLTPGSGSISGVVTTPPGTPQGGVTVTATYAGGTVTTVTASTGQVGSFTLANLPIPGTYTVTFTRSDLESQSELVQLNAGQTSASGVDVSMVANTATVTGTITQVGGGGVGDATVELVSGTATYSVPTAAAPSNAIGNYVISGIAPGTYTLNVTRTGGLPVSSIVTLAPGQTLVENEQLSPAAAIDATVVNASTQQPISGAVVDLYLTSSYAPTTQPLATTQTDQSGNFTFSNLEAPQSYLVLVSYPPGTTPSTSLSVTTQAGVTVCAETNQPQTSSCDVPISVSSGGG